MQRCVERFLNCSRASTSTAFAMALIPAVGFIAAAIDYSHASKMRTALLRGLDAAAVAGAIAHGEPDRIAKTTRVAESALAGVLPARGSRAISVAFDNKTSTVTVTASTSNDTFLARVLGVGSLTIQQVSTATWDPPVVERVGLVLDHTGSLYWNRLDGPLRDAAIRFVDLLSGGRGQTDSLHIGMVPYGTMVNVGTDKASWLTASFQPANYAPGAWSGCVRQLPYPLDVTLHRPVRGEFEAHIWPADYSDGIGLNAWAGQPVTTHRDTQDPYTGKRAFGPNQGCLPPVLPMTRNMNQVKSAIRGLEGHLSAGGGTKTGNAVTWGWRLISREWAEFWGVGTPANVFENSKATLIVLTDGVDEMNIARPTTPNMTEGFTPSGYGLPEERRLGVGPHKRTEELAADYFGVPVTDPTLPQLVNQNQLAFSEYIWREVGAEDARFRAVLAQRLLEVCANAKAAGVTIYTITLGLQNSQGHPLRQCATSPAHYEDVIYGSQLDGAFRRIADSIKAVRGVRLVR